MKKTLFTFKRFEKKYLLSREQYAAFMAVAGEHLVPDAYHKSLVCTIYYDTDDFELIRRSIEGPKYKEKIRVRSYGVPDEDGTVFVELKRKYKGVVYKRRVQMTPPQAELWLSGEVSAPDDTQITREIDWFLKMNSVVPTVSICCDRIAWVDRDDPELRITFDESIRWRRNRLHLTEGDSGEELLENGFVLMELKIPDAAPLWLARLLSDEKIFPRTFSKYGTCYKTKIIKSAGYPAEDLEI